VLVRQSHSPDSWRLVYAVRPESGGGPHRFRQTLRQRDTAGLDREAPGDVAVGVRYLIPVGGSRLLYDTTSSSHPNPGTHVDTFRATGDLVVFLETPIDFRMNISDQGAHLNRDEVKHHTERGDLACEGDLNLR